MVSSPMSTSSVAHLHVHSEYSLLDGACNIGKLAERAAAFDQPAIGLTDHGVMNGAVELYKAAKKHGVKPLLGLEAYFVDDRHVRDRKVERNHLTLLAATDEGFKNLTTLSSKGFLEGLHRGKPGVDLELLSLHSEGVIALSGCLASRTSQRIMEGKVDEARAHLDELIQIFGPEDVYLEVQKNGLTEQDQVNEAMKRFATETGQSLVGTADVHYLRREDFHHHAALLCVQTKSTLAAPKMSFSTNEFYLKSTQEMVDSFAEFPGAVESTLEIADRCEVEIALGGQLIPSFDCPDGMSEQEYLRSLVLEGMRDRYGDPLPANAVERMEMELGVIDKMGFNAYFLIVWDFVHWSKSNGIAVGPGRGSAAGSIIAYSLKITDVDPLAYDLLFERFLNAERVSMPDIDIDFSVRGRERVIRYVTEKYGTERVAQIITFGKMFPRAATRDAARVLGHDYGAGDRLAKLIPDPIMGRPPSFEDCLKPGEELANEVARDPIAKQIVDVAQGLEGIVRNASIHAAAVVISDRKLTDIVPLQLADAGTGADGAKVYRTVTQFSMKPIEEIGLLKMDFLGLRNLDVIEDALDIIERSSGVRPDMATLPLDDKKAYEMMARGDSIGVFQFESEGMREALRKVNPTEFEDLVALVALYRPGAMDQIPAYARGKRNPENITYIDDRLRPITESTKGVILYQEQAMQIAKQLAGFSGPKADDLRKAIGKKNRAAMAELQPLFIEGCQANGVARDVIESLWATNEKSADYSFNKSHAACYALISYRTAWLKANYPSEYMAALISSVMDTKDKVPFFVAQAEAMGIEILPPDVNLSDHEFMVVEGNIRFGLDAVKGVGYAAVEAIKAAREEGGDFTSLWEFCERVDGRAVNKRSIEALIKCGAFGSTGATRKGMLEVLDSAQSAGQRAQQDAQMGQGSIFDLFDGGGIRADRPAGDGEGIDRHLHLRPPAQARARGAEGQGRLLDRQGHRPARRRVGEGRRHDHRVQEDQDPLGLDDDVRDARRPRGRGGDRGLREGARRRRAGDRQRRDRARARPRRSQGGGQGLHHRLRRRQVRALRRRDRARQGDDRQAGRGQARAVPAPRGRRAVVGQRRGRPA
jgi:DNA polymerase-3 subunit alpha